MRDRSEGVNLRSGSLQRDTGRCSVGLVRQNIRKPRPNGCVLKLFD